MWFAAAQISSTSIHHKFEGRPHFFCHLGPLQRQGSNAGRGKPATHTRIQMQDLTLRDPQWSRRQYGCGMRQC